VHPGDLAGGFSDLKMTWSLWPLLYANAVAARVDAVHLNSHGTYGVCFATQ